MRLGCRGSDHAAHMNPTPPWNSPGFFSEPPVSPGELPATRAPEHSVPVPPAPAEAELEPGLAIEAQLVRMGLITLDQLAEANRRRLETGQTVADAVDRGWVARETLATITEEAAAPRMAAPFGEEPPAAELRREPAAAPPPTVPPRPHVHAFEPARPVEPVEPVERVEPATKLFRIALTLLGGEQVVVGSARDEEAAAARAREIVFDLTRPRADEWPCYAGRFLRPEAVLSVDVVEDEGTRRSGTRLTVDQP